MPHGEAAKELPLRGVVLCSTSVSADMRAQLSEYAIEMGAVHKLDLTADVTHLIVGDVKTPKYRYVAKSRPDIKVLKPEWIEEVRQQWLDGDDVDVEATEEQCRLPALYGLNICVTGFPESETRAQLETMARSNGASYSGDLTKHITHLIAAAPEGAKYRHAKQWGIACVSQKWLEESITRRMALDETLYDPILPQDEQGKGAFRIDGRPTSAAGKRPRDIEPEVRGKRKFRRTASTRLTEDSQGFWQDISAVDSIADDSGTDQWKDNNALPTKSRTAAEPQAHVTTPTANKLFTGWRMCIQGFDAAKSKKLRSVLVDMCGANIAEQPSDLRNVDAGSYCTIIPHNPPETLYHLAKSTPETVIATEWWVERCIHNKCVLDISQDVLSRPFWKTELPNLSGMRVSSTGLNSMDLRQMAEIIKTIGAVYEEQLAPTTSVLISAGTTVKKEKAYYANKHKIPVVSPDWLWSSITSKRKASFKKFQINSNVDEISQPSRGSLSGSSRPPRKAPGPFVHEDEIEQASAPLRQAKSLPLKERSPNMSPRKSQPQPIPAEKPEPPNRQIDEIRSPEELVQDISSLSRQLRKSRAAANTTEDAAPKRKKRTLGRAASAISNRSYSAEHSIDERADPWDDEHTAPGNDANVPAPGTQLGYDVPEMEAHRLQMSLKMGASFSEEPMGRRLQSLGTVKDMEVPPKPRRIKMIR